MKAAWYEKQGRASEVLTVGDMPDPAPGPGELRIRIATSGINPGDIRKRQDDFGVGMPYPRVIPHSDGAGQVGSGGRWRFFGVVGKVSVVLRRPILSPVWHCR